MNKLHRKRESVRTREQNLDLNGRIDIMLGDSEKPIWMNILDNTTLVEKERNDERRIERPMLNSNEVVVFLSEIKASVDELVYQHFTNGGKENDSALMETISLHQEVKKDFIRMLEFFIKNRAIPEDFDFKDQYESLQNFTLKDLYLFLTEMSWLDDESIEDFILNGLPSYPGCGTQFGYNET